MSPPFLPGIVSPHQLGGVPTAAPRARLGFGRARWTQVTPPTDHTRLASVRPPYVGPIGPLPPAPSSTILIVNVLTGKVRTTQLTQVFVDAPFNDGSELALRTRDPTMQLALAGAAQHGMRAGASLSTEAKNRTGCALWTDFKREAVGYSPSLRRPGFGPDPDLNVRERMIKKHVRLVVLNQLRFFVTRSCYMQARKPPGTPVRRQA